MRNCVVMLLFVFFVAGCTGTVRTITPDVTAINDYKGKKCGTVAVTGLQQNKENAKRDKMLKEFSSELEMSNFFTEVYYPVRRTDKPEYLAEVDFDEKLNFDLLGGVFKSALIGASLFTLEPLITYDYEWIYSGKINLYKEGRLVHASNHKTVYRNESKLLSLSSEYDPEEMEYMAKSRKAHYRQIVFEVGKYCGAQ